jgi:predicted PurR-regulated permease PerM
LERIERIILIVALALLGIACFLVLRPFVSAVLWAVIVALATWPLFCRLRAALNGRTSLAAGLMTFGFILILVVPLALGAIAAVRTAGPALKQMREWLDRGVPDPPAWVVNVPAIGPWLQARWQVFADDGSQLVRALAPLVDPAREWAVAAATGLGEGVFTLAISALIVFFFWRDGDVLAARMQRMMERVAGSRAIALADVAHGTIRSTVYGILGTAVAQAVLAVIGYALAGVPGAILLGIATFFLSVVPVGPPLLWLPATYWLYDRGDTGWAVFLAIWGVAVVSGVDNFLKPILISRGSHLPFVLVLIGVLGGVLAFGFIGVFIGPTLLAVAFRLIDEWTSQPARSDVR